MNIQVHGTALSMSDEMRGCHSDWTDVYIYIYMLYKK